MDGCQSTGSGIACPARMSIHPVSREPVSRTSARAASESELWSPFAAHALTGVPASVEPLTLVPSHSTIRATGSTGLFGVECGTVMIGRRWCTRSGDTSTAGDDEHTVPLGRQQPAFARQLRQQRTSNDATPSSAWSAITLAAGNNTRDHSGAGRSGYHPPFELVGGHLACYVRRLRTRRGRWRVTGS